MNEIDTRHHQEIWTLVNRLRQMRFHLTCLAHGVRGDVSVHHRSAMQENYMDIVLYMSRYHRGVQLPPLTIERDPSYVKSLQECIVRHMHPHEKNLFEQMLNLLHLMRDELWLRQPGRGDDATSIIMWLLCEQLDDLLTYMDIGGIKKVRATGGLEIRCCAESDAGHLLQARLRKDSHAGKLSLWDKPVGAWRYQGMSWSLGHLSGKSARRAYTPAALERITPAHVPGVVCLRRSGGATVIFVDALQHYPRCQLPYKHWCHMATDGDLRELHAMARRIDLNRAWFQDKPGTPHYDLTPAKRTQALKLGAQATSSEELIRCCFHRSRLDTHASSVSVPRSLFSPSEKGTASMNEQDTAALLTALLQRYGAQRNHDRPLGDAGGSGRKTHRNALLD